MKVCKHEGPEGYLQWHFWAEKRFKDGWRQKKCKKCGLYNIWVKRSKNERTRGKSINNIDI